MQLWLPQLPDNEPDPAKVVPGGFAVYEKFSSSKMVLVIF
jgi:hypothetical protein